MHHSIQLELARQHQSELLRDADRRRLAAQIARPDQAGSRRRIRLFGQLTWRERAQARPAPAA
jgi:hypothetical protein